MERKIIINSFDYPERSSTVNDHPRWHCQPDWFLQFYSVDFLWIRNARINRHEIYEERRAQALQGKNCKININISFSHNETIYRLLFIGTDYHSGYRANHFRLPGHWANCGQSENRVFIRHLVHLGWVLTLRTFRLLQESVTWHE